MQVEVPASVKLLTSKIDPELGGEPHQANDKWQTQGQTGVPSWIGFFDILIDFFSKCEYFSLVSFVSWIWQQKLFHTKHF